MKGSIKYKILPISIVGILILGIIFTGMFVNSQKQMLNEIYVKDIQSAKNTFYDLEANDIKMLQASMTDFMTNKEFKDTFVKGLEEYKKTGNCSSSNLALYNQAKELYATHKSMGITHFYFETPDDKIFLRVHGQSNCGDNLTRATYKKSKTSSSWGTGIELGATAFALRVVSPYYDGDKLIGYIEYGEEIDHFNKIMKKQTNDDFSTILKKQKIGKSYWETVTKNKGIRNNYDDLQNYLVVESTNYALTGIGECWTEKNLDTVSDEGNVFSKFNKNGNTYICGGFALYDANNQKIGTIVTVKDVTDHELASKKSIKDAIMLMMFLVIIIGGFVLYFVDRIIINPLKGLTAAGNKIAEGDIEAKIPEIKSNDEINDLSSSMTMMAGALKFLKEESVKNEAKEDGKKEKKKDKSEKDDKEKKD